MFTTHMSADTRPGPAHLATEGLPGRLLARALDELDYGIVLLTADGEVMHLNHRARRALDGGQCLRQQGRQLHTADPREQLALHDALVAAAQRGLRRMLTLGLGDEQQVLALVPVEPGVAALLLGRSQVCEDLSVQCYARNRALTAAETRVLVALGAGASPTEIAREQGVKLSTVRTQIGAIRDKTGAASITALMRRVAALPPLVGVLRT